MICFQGGPTPSRQKGRVDCTVGVKGDIKGSMGACGESQGSRENSKGTFRGSHGLKGDVGGSQGQGGKGDIHQLKF